MEARAFDLGQAVSVFKLFEDNGKVNGLSDIKLSSSMIDNGKIHNQINATTEPDITSIKPSNKLFHLQ